MNGAIVEFLRARGAHAVPHGGGRSLLEHLVETAAIVGRWHQPDWLVQAALVHSVFGTEAFREQLIPASERAELAAVAGERAARLAYLFSVVPRRALLAGTLHWAGHDAVPTRAELDALVLLHAANTAEQARAPDGSPGRWLAGLGSLARLLHDAEELSPPLVIAQLSAFSKRDETRVRGAYRDGVGRGDDPAARAERFALAAALCPGVAEPCIWLVYLAKVRGDDEGVRAWAAAARSRLGELGTAWDKRLSFEQWGEVVAGLEQGGPVAGGVTHPRGLLEAHAGPHIAAGSEGVGPAAGRERFERYVRSLDGGPAPDYPGLESRPWWDGAEIPIASYLEGNAEAIRQEILALDVDRFHPESERIGRTGDWDVAFLYERGRRHDAVCTACPVTTRGIEEHRTIRTTPGLIYASRLRAHTHIEPHRGPTNLRLRCHLALQVPDGDCAIRVGSQTRRWTEGRCLVFDDRFEHEAWNHTGEDRIVLVVDLWHPGLSPTEVTLLEGLYDHMGAYARRLGRYWSANDAVAAG